MLRVSLEDGPLIRGLRKLVADLGLDQRDFVIFGSGPLLAHKLCDDINDLDVVVRGDVWQRVADHAAIWGELVHGIHNGAPIAQFRVDDRCIQFSSGWISDEWKADELIADAELFGGLLFAKLDKVLDYKKALGRSKDYAHIEILNSHLEGQSASRQA